MSVSVSASAPGDVDDSGAWQDKGGGVGQVGLGGLGGWAVVVVAARQGGDSAQRVDSEVLGRFSADMGSHDVSPKLLSSGNVVDSDVGGRYHCNSRGRYGCRHHGFVHFNGARCAQIAPPREMVICYQDQKIRGHEMNFVVYGVRILVRVFFSGACGSTRWVCMVFSTTLGCSCNYSSLLRVSRTVLSFPDKLQTYVHT